MNDNQKFIEKKQERRYELLLALWKAADGKEKHSVSFIGVAEKNDFDKEEYSEIYNYFTSEGFLDNATFAATVCLSHSAIREIENSITNPQQPTEHFSSTVIQNYGQIGSVQTGNHTVANVNQYRAKLF